MEPVLKVSIPNTLRDHFDYAGNINDCLPGTRVWVPFRQKMRLGVVINQGEPRENLCHNQND